MEPGDRNRSVDAGNQSADAQFSRRDVLAACGAGLVGGLAGCVTQGEASDLDGEIVIDGSDTVFPHGAALAEEFQWRNNRVRIPARGSGTGAGFQRFCAGETDLQNASRSITGGESNRCEGSGIDWLELEVLLDGIAIIVHPDNDWCECLTLEELGRIWDSDSEVETWSDVRPTDPDFPDEELALYGRDTASGTFDYFTEHVTGAAGNIRRDYSGTPDSNVIVRGVRGDEHAMGFCGAGFYYENEDDLELVGIDDGDGCVRPTPESIEDRSYQPLSRSMYTYVRKDALAREEVAAFLEFYFEPVDEDGLELGRELGIVEEGEVPAWTQWAARRVGFYAVDDETVQESKAKLEAAIAEVSE